MLGWHISIYRQTDGGASPATNESPKGTRLAVWQTGLGGLDWIDELVKAGRAVYLGGNGYPLRYTAIAEHLIPRVVDEPPGAHRVWLHDPDDILTEKWEGKTVIDHAAASACRPDEWLLIEAWDES
jgi:hypothetical protein